MEEYTNLRFLMEHTMNIKLQFETELKSFIINKMIQNNYKKFYKIGDIYFFEDEDNNTYQDTELSILLIEFSNRLVFDELVIEKNIDF